MTTTTNAATAGLRKYADNPLIAGLPSAKMTDAEIFTELSKPEIEKPNPELLRLLSHRERAFLCEDIRRVQIPLDRDFELEFAIAAAIREGYVDRKPSPQFWQEGDERLARIARALNVDGQCLTNSRCLALTGVSGCGKTRSVEAILAMYKQVIVHDTSRHPCSPLKQVTWLKLDFPSNRSAKDLCRKFFEAMGCALGEATDECHSGQNLDQMVIDLARIAREHFLGLLVIDEIQHACGRSGKASPALLRFLITLSNELKLPILFVGTPRCLKELRKRLATSRRLIGPQFDRFEADDPQWLHFIGEIWVYQYTRTQTPLAPELMDEIYRLTQGIPAFAIELIVLAQRREITLGGSGDGEERITVGTFQSVYRDYLKAIDPLITALRNNDELAIEEFEDVYSDFSLEKQHAERMKQLLATESAKTERAVKKASRVARKKAVSAVEKSTEATEPELGSP